MFFDGRLIQLNYDFIKDCLERVNSGDDKDYHLYRGEISTMKAIKQW